MPAFDRERAAQVLVDAHLKGDQAAAEKWGITTRTVQRFRERLASDLELARLFKLHLGKAADELAGERRKFLMKGLAKLGQLVDLAVEPSDIGAVAGAVKVVGELQIAADVLNGGREDHQPGAGPPEAAGAAGGDAPEGELDS